jgi:hypothetical protein
MTRSINKVLEEVRDILDGEPVEESRMPRGIKATMDQLHVDFRTLDDDIRNGGWTSADNIITGMILLLNALRDDVEAASRK